MAKKKEKNNKIKEIEDAMKRFPKIVKLQERAHQHEMKIRKAFGKLSLKPTKGK
jgi:hypothetical protein